MMYERFREQVRAMLVCVGALVFATPVVAQRGQDAPAPTPRSHAVSLPTQSQSARQPSRRDPQRLDLRRRFYRDGFGFRYGVPALDQLYEQAIERAYQQGLEEGRMLERAEIQAERGYTAYHQAIADGHAAFGDGRYGLASRHFLLAATLNQGDPTSRLSAGLAQTALGEYESAVRLLRRAFELEPRIMFLPMDIRTAYGQQEDFAKHLHALRRKATSDDAVAGDHFLLGYYLYYSGDMHGAAASLDKATKLDPTDRVYARLAELARSTAAPANAGRE